MDRGAAREAAGATQQQVEDSGVLDTTTGTADKVQAKPKVEGLDFPRFFTLPGVDPFDEVEWEVRDAVIGNEKGTIVFEQRDVEMPKAWSQQATNIVVSKYFINVH